MEIGYVKILEQVGEKVHIETTGELIPSDFFKSKDGLYVDSDFTSRILSKTSIVPARDYSVQPWKLLSPANDATIESALPEQHTFDESAVSAIIADLISKQPEGAEGALANDGSWNLFYTPEFVVYVFWYSYSRHWRVGAWDRYDDAWDGGYRVFTPAN